MAANGSAAIVQKLWNYCNVLRDAGLSYGDYIGSMLAGGGEGAGSYTATLGPGGFSILTDFRESGALGNTGGHEVLTWDPQEKRYQGYAFVSEGPGCFVRDGRWEGDKLIFHREFTAGGTKVAVKFVYTEISGNSVTILTYTSFGDAPMSLGITTKATKE